MGKMGRRERMGKMGKKGLPSPFGLRRAKRARQEKINCQSLKDSSTSFGKKLMISPSKPRCCLLNRKIKL